MKKSLIALLLLSSLTMCAQIPTGYYDTATGTGYTLKTQLFNIIKGHTDQGYSGLWTTYLTSDRDHQYENDNTVLDVYSENPTGPDPYTYNYPTNQCGSYSSEGGCYNREHTVPQSYFGTGVQPMYSDAHFILPTDGKVNGWRDDHPYGLVASTSNPCNAGATNTPCYTMNGSKLGNNINSGYAAGYSQKVFEPIDEFKGDLARNLLYFVTRYEDQLVGFYSSTSEAKVMFDGTSDHSFSNTFINILLTWHNQDPVSAREIERNNAIYARQNNRNPYIDHPEYVCQIWSDDCTALNLFSVVKESAFAVYPNPTINHQITIQSDATVIDRIELINLNGQTIQAYQNPQLTNNRYELTNLSTGFYLLKLTSNHQTIVKKVIVQ
jgi:endonuclease I